MKQPLKILALLAAILVSSTAIYLTAFSVNYYATGQHLPKTTKQEQNPTLNVPTPPTIDSLLKLVNEERVRVGVAPLTIDPRLNQSAQQKADDMVTNDYFGHVDKNGRHGYDIAHEKAPDACTSPGENLGWNSKKELTTSERMFAGWKKSPSHYKAMIDSKYTITGLGIGSNFVVVQHFC